MAKRRGWTCQRRTAGAACKHRNPSIKRKCERCGKPRPARKQPAHMAALKLDYEWYKQLNGGEFCAICKRRPSANRRLDRDHDHKTGKPRGLLCVRCNRWLASWITAEFLRAAAEYLERGESVGSTSGSGPD